MSKKKEKTAAAPEVPETESPEILEEQDRTDEVQADAPGAEPETAPEEAGAPAQELTVPKEQFLRLAAEYDNYRKRTAKEKEGLWTSAKAALKQDTADAAFKKGVEMTMDQLKEIFAKLGVSEIPALGQTFDPNLHNAVMHIEDESLGENTIAQVFRSGFTLGDKVIRFAMVQVAN